MLSLVAVGPSGERKEASELSKQEPRRIGVQCGEEVEDVCTR